METLLTKNSRSPLPYLALVSMILLLNCRGDDGIEAALPRPGRYRTSLYASEAECRRINPNLEIVCYSWVEFSPDGSVIASIGGSDIIIRGSYLQQDNTIALTLPFKTIVFIIQDGETLIDYEKMVWKAY